MTTTRSSPRPSRYRHHPREIAAAVTLRAGAAALVRPDRPLTAGSGVAVTTACGALATRIALVAFLAKPDLPDVAALRAFDPYVDPTPDALHGVGPSPDRDRVRTAGDRCVAAWRRWSADDGACDGIVGVAGALALGAWCSWALGSEARARTRAQYARDLVPDDPLAELVLRTCRAGRGPSWDRGHSPGSITVG